MGLRGRRRYFGDVAKAARLYAARGAAGFATAREAALHFGWRESRYRAHESAVRDISDADALAYCEAYGVSVNWLKTGHSGPADIGRRETSLTGAWRQRQERLLTAWRKDDKSEAPPAPAHRVRLARRLAGHHTVTAAARELGFVHTTLSGAERGIHKLTESTARKYAAAFGCEPAWLLEGTLPSGYPTHIDKLVPRLLTYYDLPEREARERFPDFIAEPRPHDALDEKSEPTPLAAESPLDRVGQYEPSAFHRCFSFLPDLGSATPTLVWALPSGYLHDVLAADPKHTVVIVAPHDLGPFQAGDRLFVDMSDRRRSADIYVAVEHDWPRFIMLDGSRLHQMENFDQAVSKGELAIIGRVVGRLGSLRHRQ
jgi:transcriptional regulator with XRE-family HTH domain